MADDPSSFADERTAGPCEAALAWAAPRQLGFDTEVRDALAALV